MRAPMRTRARFKPVAKPIAPLSVRTDRERAIRAQSVNTNKRVGSGARFCAGVPTNVLVEPRSTRSAAATGFEFASRCAAAILLIRQGIEFLLSDRPSGSTYDIGYLHTVGRQGCSPIVRCDEQELSRLEPPHSRLAIGNAALPGSDAAQIGL